MDESNERFYVRFSLAQRYLHWALAGTFLGLAFTGLQLRFSTAPWIQAIARAVGGFGAILFFHKFFAIGLTITFGYHLLTLARGILVERDWSLLWGPKSMVPRWKDVQD